MPAESLRTTTSRSEWLKIRPAEETDVGFIINSWLKNQRDVGDHYHMVNGIYFKQYRDRVLGLLASGKTAVACDPEDGGTILGYITRGERCIHMLYVKHDFRRLGIGRELVLATGPSIGGRDRTVSTCLRPDWDMFRRKWNLIYDPEAR